MIIVTSRSTRMELHIFKRNNLRSIRNMSFQTAFLYAYCFKLVKSLELFSWLLPSFGDQTNIMHINYNKHYNGKKIFIVSFKIVEINMKHRLNNVI